MNGKRRWGKVVESGFTVNVLLLVASLLNTAITQKEHRKEERREERPLKWQYIITIMYSYRWGRNYTNLEGNGGKKSKMRFGLKVGRIWIYRETFRETM